MDDDDLFCAFVSPPLSSVIVPDEQIGYEAARLLDMLVRGRRPPAGAVLAPPPGISTRRSSDVYAVGDRELEAATRFIRAHAHESIGVRDILRQATVSRSTMEHRFRTVLGRTMLDEIRRVRIERAKDLLGNSDLRVAAVARRTGFGNQARFSVVFRQEAGETPVEYRKRFRLHEDGRGGRQAMVGRGARNGRGER